MTSGNAHLIRNISFFIAILATAIALGGALAHAFEFFTKMGMSQADYFITQTIYSGWNKLAFVLLIELIAIIAVVMLHWGTPAVRWPAIAALAFMLTSQAVFWIWTFPANVATNNWTEQPDNWQILRQQWEYSHFAGAIFQLLSLSALTVSVLRRP